MDGSGSEGTTLKTPDKQLSGYRSWQKRKLADPELATGTGTTRECVIVALVAFPGSGKLVAVGRRLELHPGSDPEFPLIRRSRRLAAIPTSKSKATGAMGRNYEQMFVVPPRDTQASEGWVRSVLSHHDDGERGVGFRHRSVVVVLCDYG